MNRMKMYARTESSAMWCNGWLLEAWKGSAKNPGDLIICKRIRRERLAQFRNIAGCFEVEADRFFIK